MQLTAHFEPGPDLGQLNLLVRGLDVDVVPASDGMGQLNISRMDSINGEVGTYLKEMKSPSLTKVIVRLLSSL